MNHGFTRVQGSGECARIPEEALPRKQPYRVYWEKENAKSPWPCMAGNLSSSTWFKTLSSRNAQGPSHAQSSQKPPTPAVRVLGQKPLGGRSDRLFQSQHSSLTLTTGIDTQFSIAHDQAKNLHFATTGKKSNFRPQAVVRAFRRPR